MLLSVIYSISIILFYAVLLLVDDHLLFHISFSLSTSVLTLLSKLLAVATLPVRFFDVDIRCEDLGGGAHCDTLIRNMDVFLGWCGGNEMHAPCIDEYLTPSTHNLDCTHPYQVFFSKCIIFIMKCLCIMPPVPWFTQKLVNYKMSLQFYHFTT